MGGMTRKREGGEGEREIKRRGEEESLKEREEGRGSSGSEDS